MYQYYVVEVQKTAGGEFAHNVSWHWDESADKARLKAESKYHEVLSFASVSELAEHSAILFASDGTPIMNQCYKHDAVPAVEEE